MMIVKLYKIDELKPFTGEGRTKTYDSVRLGRLKPLKVGKSTFFTESEIARFQREELGVTHENALQTDPLASLQK